jgi:peptidoglycan hydrolase-like protein with peptidoglycan-binding domain
MIEPYAYLHLALETETETEYHTTLEGINTQQLSTRAYSCFLSLAVMFAVLNVAGKAIALLTVGDTGTSVQQVQQRLQELGYFHPHPTGYYGTITHHAVLQFQHDQGLPADGIVGKQTLSALKLSIHPQPQSHQPQPKPQPKPQSHQPQPKAHYNPIVDNRHLIGLGVGDQGPGVKDLQNRLKELGFFHAHPTGYFGPITRHAVIEFQKQCSLTATGLVTEDTLAALNSRDLANSSYRQSALLLPAQFLKKGDVGATVGLLQQRLQQLGYYHGLITQSYDEETAAAVREFQNNNGIEANGMVGPTTQSHIREKLTYTARQPRRHSGVKSNQNASQYLQRQLRSQGHPRVEFQQNLDSGNSQELVTPQKVDQPKPTDTLSVSDWYEQTQVKPRLQSTSFPRRPQPSSSHPLRVTDTFLELGDTGTAVRGIQRRLRQLNFYNGPINGLYDPATEQAVIRFQRANQITQTGVVGPTTQTYLFNARSPAIAAEENETEN